MRRLGAALAAAVMLSSIVAWGPVAAASPMTITNVDSPDPVVSGSQILYTITVTNTGGAKVTEAVLTDQVNGVVGFGNPPLLDVVSSRGGCTQANTQVTCNAGTIEGGGVWTVTVRGIVTSPGGTTINNIATVTATKSATTFTNSASATTQVTGSGPGGSSPDLTIGKNGPLNVTPGSSITYTLTVNNVGTANAVGIKVRDSVPTAVTITGITATSLFVCPTVPVASNTIECTDGRVNAGANATITIHGTVAPSASGQLENTSVVDPENTIDEGELGNTADAAELNNQSNTVVTTVSPVPPPPNNVISIDATGPPTAIPNEVIHYTLTVTNGTLGRADYVTVTNGTQGLQAASLTVESATAPDGGTTPSCTVSAPTVTCTMTRLPVGGHVIVKIAGTVIAAAGSTIIDSAKVTANVKNTGYSATDEVQTIINAGKDLTITKSDMPDPVCASSFPTTDPPPPTNCKGGLAYTFKVGNSGIQDAKDVLVRDVLPPGTTYDDAASSSLCDATNGVVTCTIPTLAAGTVVSITIVLVAPATTGQITNTVTVDPFNAILEADETNNIAVEKTTVSTGIDLTIAKGDNPATGSPDGFDPIATSGTQTYRITVDNVGTQDASNILIRDTLPAGTIFLSAKEIDPNGALTFPGLHNITCTHNGAATGGVVDCTGGSLLGTANESYFPSPPLGDDKITIEIKVFARPTVGTMHNEARVDPLGTIAEYNESNNIATQDTTVTTGDSSKGAFNELAIAKTIDPPATSVATSSLVVYKLVVTNSGTDPAVNVTVKDFLPSGFTFLSAQESPLVASDPFPFTCSVATGNVVECTGATLDGTTNAFPGGGGEVDIPTSRTILVRTLSSAIPALGYVNTARVDPANAIPEGNEGNNASSAAIDVVLASGQFIDLTIDKDDGLAAGAHATPGGQITYTLTVSNTGTNPALNVAVRDAIPAGTTFVSAKDVTVGDGAFSCTESGGVVTCTGATIDGSLDLAGASVPTVRKIELVVKAPVANTAIFNQAVVDPSNLVAESNEANNTSTEMTLVRSNIDLELDKTGPGSATQGQPSDYEITVKNTGTATAFDVLVRDPLPVGLIPLEVHADGDFTCQVLQNPVNVVECTGTLLAGTEAKIKIHVFVTQDGGTLDNEACVDPDDTILEFNAAFPPDGNGNNCKTKVTVVQNPKADVQVTKSASSGTVAPGADLTYTISVQNNGTATTQSPVTVSDILPSSVTFVTSNATNGWTCTGTTTVQCTNPGGGGLAPGESTSITIDVKVKTDASAPITNTASAPVDPGDPTASPPIDPEDSTDNNTASVTTNVSGSGFDLAVTSITDTPDPANREEQLVYTVIAQNNGSAPTTPPNAAKVRIAMPTGATGVSIQGAAGTNGFNCGTTTPTSFPFDCVGDLPAGGETTITVTLNVLIGAPDDLVLSATVDPDAAFTESDEGNNSAIEVTTVTGAPCTVSPCIDLVAAEILSSPAGPVGAGASVNYTFGVVNIGDTSTDPNAAHIHFGVTGTFTAASITAAAGWTCTILTNSAGNKEWFCDGTLGAGAGAVFSIQATAGSADGSITATGVIDPHLSVDEFNETNNGPISVVTTVDVP